MLQIAPTTTTTTTTTTHLWLEVVSKLRRDLDGVVAALRVAVLHVSVASVAHTGADVVQVGTCHS